MACPFVLSTGNESMKATALYYIPSSQVAELVLLTEACIIAKDIREQICSKNCS
jgi:hypothetical protein